MSPDFDVPSFCLRRQASQAVVLSSATQYRSAPDWEVNVLVVVPVLVLSLFLASTRPDNSPPEFFIFVVVVVVVVVLSCCPAFIELLSYL